MPDFTIKPAPGRAVRDPLTLALLPANGDRKPRSGYWLRRLIDGDVVEVETKKAKSLNQRMKRNEHFI